MAVSKRAQSAQENAIGLASRNNINVGNTAQAYLSLLGARGIEYFFANGGTDFASIIEGFARLTAEGRKVPKPVTVPHEMVAASMAHGYYLVTGRPQVVMVHVTVGTANLLAAMMNSSRAKVPIIFTAGRTPLTEKGLQGSRNIHIHWAQESFDQGDPSTREASRASGPSGTTNFATSTNSRRWSTARSRWRWRNRAVPSISHCHARCWRSSVNRSRSFPAAA